MAEKVYKLNSYKADPEKDYELNSYETDPEKYVFYLIKKIKTDETSNKNILMRTYRIGEVNSGVTRKDTRV